MEVEKLFKISIEYLSDYLGALLSTIRSPKPEFPPVESPVENNQILTSGPGYKVVKLRLNPKLLSFLLISIFVGSALNANIRGRSPAPDFAVTLIIIIVCWLLFSSLVHVFCKAFGGRGSLLETISINLQVLAVIYVLSSSAAFLWGVASTGLKSGETVTYLQGLVGGILVREPIYAYFVVQSLLVLIYLPLANSRVHKFSFSRIRRMMPKGAFARALSLTEAALFYVVFLTLSLVIVGLSKTNYHVHNIPLSQPEISVVSPSEYRAVFSPDGKSIAVQGEDRTVRLWDVNPGTQIPSASPDKDWKVLKLWDVETGKSITSAIRNEKNLFDGILADRNTLAE
jgi:hypothetical protein